ncbi:MAG: fructosamine kinase family protein, partial [Clostridia bacterium]|nr:fructosamine kinase family protein [Clostridia bacterium]
LFGGYQRAFYEAYEAAAPLQPGYEDRRDLYNLYHLLNHLNLFGFSYAASVHRLLTRYG